MKKHNILIALAMMIMVVFSACSGESPQEPGNVRVILDSWQNTRSLESNVLLDTASYGITAFWQGSETVEPVCTTVEASSKDATLSLFPGVWKIQVDAFNADRQKIGVGMSDPVTITSGQTSSCTVKVNECSGMGTLNLRIAGVYDENVLKATVEREMGDPSPIIFNLEKADGTYYGSMNLEHGSYLFNVSLNGEEIWTEAVRVVANGQTNADVLISSGNRIQMTTQPDVKINRIFSDSLEDGGTVDNGTSCVFHSVEPSFWYVNGMRQTTEKTCDFTWLVFGLTAGDSCNIGALSGHDSYDTFTSMHLTAADTDSRIVTASVENHTYMVGGNVRIDFKGLPAGETPITIHVGPNYSHSIRLRPDLSSYTVMIPPHVTEAGEFEITFTTDEGSGIIIPPLRIKLGLPNFAPSYNIHVAEDAYLGDGIRIVCDKLPFGVEVRGYLDGKEKFRETSHHRGQTSFRFFFSEYDAINEGVHDLEVKFYNAGRELPLAGNKVKVNINGEYVIPEGLSVVAEDPVYVNGNIRFKVSPTIPVDMKLQVTCDGVKLPFNTWINGGSPVFELGLPSDIKAGSHTFTFKGEYNNKLHELPSCTVQVNERMKKEVVVELPKYISKYDNNVDVACNDPDFISYRGDINWLVNDKPVQSSWKDEGENEITLFFDSSLIAGNKYVVTGNFSTADRDIAIKPITFIASENSLYLNIKSTFAPDKVNYSITPEIVLEGKDTYRTFTLNVKDGDLMNLELPVENGKEYRWIYDGKKPILHFVGEVRDANGVLLLKDDYTCFNFQTEMSGPDTIYLSDTVNESMENYKVVLNRDDIDWGPDFGGSHWLLDDTWPGSGNSIDIKWNRSMKGSHRLVWTIQLGNSRYYVATKNILVTEENLDSAMAFNISNIRRMRSDLIAYEFDLTSDVPIDEHLLGISVFVDGKEVLGSRNVRFERASDGTVTGGYFWLPDYVTTGKTLTIKALRLDNNKNVVSRVSVDHAMKESYLAYYGSFHRDAWLKLSIGIYGPMANEQFDVVVDGKVITEYTVNDSSILLNPENLGCGLHELKLRSKFDPSCESESISWYSDPGIRLVEEDQTLNPDESMTCTLSMFKLDPDLNPGDVTYRMAYQYPGKAKVDLGSNSTGVYEIPTAEPDALKVHVWYESTCGNEHYERDFDLALSNCRFVGMPAYIVKGSAPKDYPIKLEWYNNLINENDFEFEWRINDNRNVANGTSVTLSLPEPDVNYLDVWLIITSKTDSKNKSSIFIHIDLVDSEPLT